MALLDELYGKAFGWLWVNTKMCPHCEPCASGRAAHPIKGRILTRFFHRIDGEEIVCKSPWPWRRRVANGMMKVE